MTKALATFFKLLSGTAVRADVDPRLSDIRRGSDAEVDVEITSLSRIIWGK